MEKSHLAWIYIIHNSVIAGPFPFIYSGELYIYGKNYIDRESQHHIYSI